MDFYKEVKKSLGLRKYKAEKNIDYRARLYYISISYWVQEFLRIHNYYGQADKLNRDYLIGELEKIARYIYRLLRPAKDWLREEDIELFLEKMIEIKIYNLNLIEDKSGLLSPDYRPIKYKDLFILPLIKGVRNIEETTVMSRISKENPFDDFIDLDSEIEKRKLGVYKIFHNPKLPFKNFGNLEGRVEFFIPNKLGLFSQSWIDDEKLRNEECFNIKGRCLVRNNGKYYVYSLEDRIFYYLDNFYKEEGEIYRIMDYLYSQSKYMAKNRLVKHEDYLKIQVLNPLARPEDIIVKNISMPYLSWWDYKNISLSRKVEKIADILI